MQQAPTSLRNNRIHPPEEGGTEEAGSFFRRQVSVLWQQDLGLGLAFKNEKYETDYGSHGGKPVEEVPPIQGVVYQMTKTEDVATCCGQ